MDGITEYRANEKKKKRRYPRIRATFNEWKRGRAIRIPIMAVAIFILCAGVKLQADGKPSKTLYVISILLFLAWYVVKIATAKTAFAAVKGRDNELVQISNDNVVYSYRSRMDESALGQDIAVMFTMQRSGIKEVVEKTKPKRLEITGSMIRQVCTPDQFLNRHNPSVKIKKGTKENRTITLYDYYDSSAVMYEKIKDLLA